MDVPCLESYIASSAQELLQWCQTNMKGSPETTATCASNQPLDESKHELLDSATTGVFSFPTRNSANDPSDSSSDNWWAVKASRGNGGKDVWIIHPGCYEEVISTLPPNEEYVLQRYLKYTHNICNNLDGVMVVCMSVCLLSLCYVCNINV
jgi:hypothetical protein